MTDFSLWTRENLNTFASEVTTKLFQQSEEIEALRADLKAAIEAYRAINTKRDV